MLLYLHQPSDLKMWSSSASLTDETSTQSPRRILLVSIPRTASNLLAKVLNVPDQPNVHTNEKNGSFFFSAFMAVTRTGHLEKPADEWTIEEKDKFRGVYQSCFDKMEKDSDETDVKGKVLFAKEHSFRFSGPACHQRKITGVHNEEFMNVFRVDIPQKYGLTRTYSPLNETIFSDEYRRSWKMAFIIRHPALTVPSFYRAMVKLSKEGMVDEDGVEGNTMRNMDLRWSRSLYDWNLQQDEHPPPPIIDAYDLIHSPEVVLKFCEQIGMDPGALKFEWKVQSDQVDHSAPDEKVKQISAQSKEDTSDIRGRNIMLNTLMHSSRMLKDKTPVDVDIPGEVVKWKAEFGDEVAELIEKVVLDTMPDYEYLKARRGTV